MFFFLWEKSCVFLYLVANRSPMDSQVWKWAWLGSIGCSGRLWFFYKKNNCFASLIDHSFIESPLLLLPVAEQEYRDHDHADHSKTQADDHELVHLRLLDAWKKNKNKLYLFYLEKTLCQTHSRSRPTCPPTLSRPSRSY